MTKRSVSRRTLLSWTGGALCGAVLLPGARARDALDAVLEESNVVYLTPLRSDGRESSCQAEVWFAADPSGVYVVTAADAWRARAVERGLRRARIWVGDVGVWSRSDRAYRELPSMEASASRVTDPAEHERVLALMGDKYVLQWLVWGRRFRNGLSDGSRVMLRYQPLRG